MTSGRGWGESVTATWMGEVNLRHRLDRRVRGWLGQRRGLAGRAQDSVGALTVDRAHTEILRLGEVSLWLSCATTIALAGELILGAQKGMILSNAVDDWNMRVDPQAWTDVHAMNYLRNVYCHPACPPVTELARHLKGPEKEPLLGRRVEEDWTIIGTREFAEYGLRKLDALGRHVMDRSNI